MKLPTYVRELRGRFAHNRHERQRPSLPLPTCRQVDRRREKQRKLPPVGGDEPVAQSTQGKRHSAVEEHGGNLAVTLLVALHIYRALTWFGSASARQGELTLQQG